MKNNINSKIETNNEIKNNNNQESSYKLSVNNILQKNNDICIIFKESKKHINLLNNNSFYKICSLINISPEKYIKFKSRKDITDSDSDNGSNSSLKGMAKLKERLLKSENNKYNHLSNGKNKNYYNKKRNNKYLNNSNDSEKNSVILLDEVKSSVKLILNKEGNSIGTNYELYKMTWKNLYKWLLVFPLNILFGLIFFIYKDNYGFSLAEFFCFLIIFLVCIVSMDGNEKMLAKKKVNFQSENIRLILISSLSLYILICANTNMVEYTAYCFLNKFYFLVHAIFFTLIIFCFVLIYLNKKMVGFYQRYSKILQSGLHLTDRT